MGGRPGGKVPRFVSQSLHRNVALLSVVALGVHVATAVMDTFVDIRWWQTFIPVGSGFEPLWIGLGALSLDLLAVVVMTSLLRTRLRYRSWRMIHVSSWAAWVLAVAHGAGAGTDLPGAPWALVPTVLCVAVVAAALGGRMFLVVRDRSPVRSSR